MFQKYKKLNKTINIVVTNVFLCVLIRDKILALVITRVKNRKEKAYLSRSIFVFPYFYGKICQKKKPIDPFINFLKII